MAMDFGWWPYPQHD
jgi:hypothetical protein